MPSLLVRRSCLLTAALSVANLAEGEAYIVVNSLASHISNVHGHAVHATASASHSSREQPIVVPSLSTFWRVWLFLVSDDGA